MLEVGVTTNTGDGNPPPLSYVEARTNFGAWCILSSPLICECTVPPRPHVCLSSPVSVAIVRRAREHVRVQWV